ncbi:MAG: hypothetical protein LBR97_03370 [Dysgonamonadaceae bacterium]|jgi:hypothetical protein|nr:hypothetical protein [Dysgonamonadaceae bacterium]
MNENLKVSFYLKREKKNEKSSNTDTVYPVVGKIIIGIKVLSNCLIINTPCVLQNGVLQTLKN